MTLGTNHFLKVLLKSNNWCKSTCMHKVRTDGRTNGHNDHYIPPAFQRGGYKRTNYLQQYCLFYNRCLCRTHSTTLLGTGRQGSYS